MKHERVAALRRHLRRHPEDGPQPDTGVRVRRLGPLRFEAVTADGRRVEADMPDQLGGTDQAMSPGTLLRSALGCCDATALAIEAAARGIELSVLEVAVSSDSDYRGMLDLDDVPAGPLAVRVSYRLGSPGATADELHSLVEHAEQHSPVLQALRREVPVATETEIV